jgi:hypothetical protein
MNKSLILSAFALVAAPVLAAPEWSFYGSARVSTFGEAVIDTGDADTKTSNYYKFQPNSRFGATAKDGELGGTFEVGYGAVVTDAATGKTTDAIVLRKLFGTWQINQDLALLLGQDFTPIYFAANNQVWGGDNNLGKQGAIGSGRLPQARLSGYGAKLALLNGKQTTIKAGRDADTTSYVARPANTPKVELTYDHVLGNAHVGIGLGYNGYKLDAATLPNSNYESAYAVTNFVGALDFGFKSDAVKINASAGYALNGNEYGLTIGNPFKAYIDAEGELVNTSSVLGFLNVNIPISEAVTPELGAGLENHSQDFGDETATDTRITLYGQVTLAPAKKVAFIPEFGAILESGTDKAGESYDKPTIVYYGVKSQISF